MGDENRRGGEGAQVCHARSRADSDENIRIGCHARQEQTKRKTRNGHQETGLGGACLSAHIL